MSTLVHRSSPTVGLGRLVPTRAKQRVELFACRDRQGLREPYDRLLGDAMEGEALLFAREDEVEAAWGVVAPVLDSPTPPHEYEPGTWGPRPADAMLSEFGGWHEPRAGGAS